MHRDALIYSTYLGGSNADSGNGVAVDAGDAYVSGVTGSTNFPTANPFQGTRRGSGDAFVTKSTEPAPPPTTSCIPENLNPGGLLDPLCSIVAPAGL